MQYPSHILPLVSKYLDGSITDAELVVLNEWYRCFDNQETILTPTDAETREDVERALFEKISHSIKQDEPPVLERSRKKWLLPAAASIILFLSATVIYKLISPTPTSHIVQQNTGSNNVAVSDIAPGGNKAMLVLEDGSTISLDNAAKGILGTQGNVKVEKLSNGLLAYTINGKTVFKTGEVYYNTITTPRGGEYQITLSDGTSVLLNAMSSIRFPVLFTGKEREVTITGEAYFEVAKNRKRPFKVKAGASVVEVLGTHFNVNAYNDEESIKTTLLEGKVKVYVPEKTDARAVSYLNPGQQSDVTKSGKIKIVKNVDTDEAAGWKDGIFKFSGANITTILRQLTRWYDVEIVYKEKVDLHFSGQLTRSWNMSEAFKILQMTGEVHFQIDGNKVLVTK